MFAVKAAAHAFRGLKIMLGQIFLQQQFVWLQVVAQYRKVNPLKAMLGVGGLEHKGIALLLGPARQIFRAVIKGEIFLPCYLAYGIPAKLGLAVTAYPIGGGWPRVHL